MIPTIIGIRCILDISGKADKSQIESLEKKFNTLSEKLENNFQKVDQFKRILLNDGIKKAKEAFNDNKLIIDTKFDKYEPNNPNQKL